MMTCSFIPLQVVHETCEFVEAAVNLAVLVLYLLNTSYEPSTTHLFGLLLPVYLSGMTGQTQPARHILTPLLSFHT